MQEVIIYRLLKLDEKIKPKGASTHWVETASARH